MNRNFFMKLAIDKAWEFQLLTYPNPAVGAVVVRDGAVLAISAHRRAGESHAEVIALSKAYEQISNKEFPVDRFNANEAHRFLLSLPKGFFRECEIYVTLEPCSHIGKTPSCASLISSLGIKRVYIGAKDPISSHSGGIEMLKDSGIEVEVGIMQKECEALIEPFTIWQKRAFILFKLAQTSNGKITGGYISSKESLEYVHKIRSVISAMVIGGNTVRIDRPKLDCRLIDTSIAPNIYIYSKGDNFDRDIPLFSVKSREVKIISDIEPLLDKPSLILVEGGEGMLEALKDHIDWLLIFQAPKLSKTQLSYNIDSKLEFLHFRKIDIDLMIWSRFGK